jgi:hypothetical protein
VTSSFAPQGGGLHAQAASGRGPGGGPAVAGPRLSPQRRRRSWPRVASGGVIVAGCVFGFLAAASALAGGRAVQVLAVARAVPAGAVLTAGDLTVVQLRPAAGVATVPASRRGELAGQPAAVPLAAGQLLAPGDLGPGRFPPAGKAVVALPLAAGAWPPALQPGARVAVLDGRAAAGAGAAPPGGQPAGGAGPVLVGRVTAIAAVSAADGGAGVQAVVSVLVDTAAAQQAEELSSPVLVLLDPAGTDVP